MREYDPPHEVPEESTVTLPLSQVVGWVENSMRWEEHAATAQATGAAALTPELIRPDGKPTVEFAKATLAGAVQGYTPLFIKAFHDHDQVSPLLRPKTSPQSPKYKNTEIWGRHVEKFGNKITWQEDSQYGVHNFQTTYLQDASGNKELVGFKVATVERERINTISFAISNGAIKRISHAGGKRSRFRSTQKTIFELELEPTLLVRQWEEHFRDELFFITLRFDSDAGKFKGGHMTDRSLDWVQHTLAEALQLVPEEYRPLSSSS